MSPLKTMIQSEKNIKDLHFISQFKSNLKHHVKMALISDGSKQDVEPVPVLVTDTLV